MKRFFTASRETGDIIEGFDSIAMALDAIECYEEKDQEEGTYEPNLRFLLPLSSDDSSSFETPLPKREANCGILPILVYKINEFYIKIQTYVRI